MRAVNGAVLRASRYFRPFDQSLPAVIFDPTTATMARADEGAPLIAEASPRRRWVPRVVAVACVVAVEVGVLSPRRGSGRAPLPALYGGSPPANKQPDASRSLPTPTYWASSNVDDVGRVVEFEEHVATFSDTIVTQSWTVAAHVLFGDVGAAAGILDPDVGVRATTYDYSDRDAFQRVLDAGLLPAGAVVYGSVVSMMDNDVEILKDAKANKTKLDEEDEDSGASGPELNRTELN